MDQLTLLFHVGSSSSPSSFSYTPTTFFLTFLSIPTFCFFNFLLLYLSIFFPSFSFLLLHIHIFFFSISPVLHISGFTFLHCLPQSNTEPSHFPSPSHLPHIASNLLAGTTLLRTNHCPHISLYKPHNKVRPTFDFTLEGRTDRLSRNFGRGLPPYTV